MAINDIPPGSGGGLLWSLLAGECGVPGVKRGIRWQRKHSVMRLPPELPVRHPLRHRLLVHDPEDHPLFFVGSERVATRDAGNRLR